MICDSGTPLLRSKDIAFTAEFPVNTLQRLDTSATTDLKNGTFLLAFYIYGFTTNLKLEQGQGGRHVGLIYLLVTSRILTVGNIIIQMKKPLS